MNSLIGNYGGESEDEENQPPRKVQRSSVSPSSLPPSPSPSQNVAPEAVELDVYEKGEQAVYLSNQPCVIVAKHMDDYPNLYYTIQLVNEGKREKFYRMGSSKPAGSPQGPSAQNPREIGAVGVKSIQKDDASCLRRHRAQKIPRAPHSRPRGGLSQYNPLEEG